MGVRPLNQLNFRLLQTDFFVSGVGPHLPPNTPSATKVAPRIHQLQYFQLVIQLPRLRLPPPDLGISQAMPFS